MEVAIVGTSPVMTLLAIRLARLGISVFVFEADENQGGAWRLSNEPDKQYSLFNNNIFPENQREAEQLPALATFIRQSGIPCSIKQSWPRTNRRYQPNMELVVDIKMLLEQLSCEPLVTVRSERVGHIQILQDHVELNKFECDYAFVPRHFSSITFTRDKQTSITVPRTIVSHHVWLHFAEGYDDQLVADFMEDIDNVFDRCQFRMRQDAWQFVGRVRQQYKNLPTAELLNYSESLKVHREHIASHGMSTYEDNTYSDDAMKRVTDFIYGSRVQSVNTYSFISGVEAVIALQKWLRLNATQTRFV